MPVQVLSISHTEASKIVAAVIEQVNSDGGSPVAVAVVDHAGRLVSFTAMDNVMPASIKLAQAKAYSAVIGQRDTIKWASLMKSPDHIDFDMRNWADENFTGFTGGIVICCNNGVIGGVAVSGRKGKKDENDLLMQDNELAIYGLSVLKL